MPKVLILCLLSWVVATAAAQPSCEPAREWPEWEHTKASLISDAGRVIDASDPRQITTSEGQSYALFMALVNNEPRLFRELLQWTQRHLAEGSLDHHLPAWLWGRQPSGEWGVLDNNSAADSDLWLAYTLLEAGRLWQEFEYTRLAHAMLRQIAEQEIAVLPGLGTVLLPAPAGFVHDQTWRLNPSYLPPQLVARVSEALPRKPWLALNEDAASFLERSSPFGIAPDWISWHEGEVLALSEEEAVGSYDAIRVYLWVGMMDNDATANGPLQAHFADIANFVDAQGRVAEHIQSDAQQHWGVGPPGFSAALLPLLGDTDTGTRLRQHIAESRFEALGYYNQMLWLFGMGWTENRFRFDANGKLIPLWVDCS